MKNKTVKLLIACLCIAMLSATMLVACNKDSDKLVSKENVYIESSSLYVQKVENMREDFILGVDASAVPSLEAGGVKYYDFDGNEQDVFKTLSDSGINYIRVRVWNDPYDENGNGYGGGNCDIDTAVEIGKRATQYGLRLLVNFHYSDFWADPAKQMVPKAWQGMTIDEKCVALYNYTHECLTKLKNEGVDVGMVQIGNETNGAMSGEKIWMNIYKLMAQGSKATREVFPDALIAVHFANPEKVTNYQNYASKLAYYNLDYDVFASSYYPYWHGTLENLTSLLSEIATTYDKKVMVAETSYAYTDEDTDYYGNTISSSSAIVKKYPFTVQGQANCTRDVIEAVANMTNGIGVFYWEGTWIASGGSSWEENSALWEQYGSGWATSYAADYDPNDAGKYYGGCAVDNQALFDENGHPLESLKVFGLARHGNTTQIKADAIQDTTLIVDLAGTIELPQKVYAVMSDNSKSEVDVVWNNVDYDAMYSGGVAKYDIYGVADGMVAYCQVSMVEYNFLNNYSFEDVDDTSWVVIGGEGMDELYNEEKSTDSLTGTRHFHFWSEAENSVEFSLEQTIENLPSGTYKYTISIMGGDGGTTDIYAYVKINGVIVATDAMQITSYGNWDDGFIDNIVYSSEDTITFGIYVKCQGSGAGAWGKIDDALVNSKTE